MLETERNTDNFDISNSNQRLHKEKYDQRRKQRNSCQNDNINHNICHNLK